VKKRLSAVWRVNEELNNANYLPRIYVKGVAIGAQGLL
jgi:hypothetical protein